MSFQPHQSDPSSGQNPGLDFDTPASSNIDNFVQQSTVEDAFNALARRIEELETQLRASQQPTTTTTATTQPDHHKLKKAKLPQEFKGDRTTLNGFLTQLTIYFANRTSEFPTDYDRILFASSFFRDKALSWLRPQLEFYLTRLQDPDSQYSPMFENYEEFVRQLRVTFGDINEEATAERELRMLRQTKSVGFYTSEFQRIASILQWDEKALIYAFYSGLKEGIKDEIARVGRPTTLNEIISLSTQIDSRLFERLREQRFEQRNFSTPRITPSPFIPTRTSNPQSTFPEPMDLSASTRTGRSKLTPIEREHRMKNNLCLYCGQAGHKVITCPLLASRTTAAASTPFENSPLEQASKLEASNFSVEEN